MLTARVAKLQRLKKFIDALLGGHRKSNVIVLDEYRRKRKKLKC
jgi:hypothetical protein